MYRCDSPIVLLPLLTTHCTTPSLLMSNVACEIVKSSCSFCSYTFCSCHANSMSNSFNRFLKKISFDLFILLYEKLKNGYFIINYCEEVFCSCHNLHRYYNFSYIHDICKCKYINIYIEMEILKYG